MVENNKDESVVKPSKKKLVLLDVFETCRKRGDYTFDNALVKKIAEKHKFQNPFDATKIDNSSALPDEMQKAGYCVVHLGRGKHKFVKSIRHAFHAFENIEESNKISWPYRKSALNEVDSSESNILSIGFNQRIMHDFLYEDIVANPKIYAARRTKITDSYKIGNEIIELDQVQVEIDMTTEYLGNVTLFEGKNKFPKDFFVCQLFHPFLHFQQLKKKGKIAIDEINCCYLLRKIEKGNSIIRLYLYSFANAKTISSLYLKKCAEYRLVKR